jgi:mannose-6-phosphate isomerase-like protein (cupin superfamily)
LVTTTPLRTQPHVKLDGEDIQMDKGDCLYFAGETPHEVRSVGRQKAEVLVVVALAP